MKRSLLPMFDRMSIASILSIVVLCAVLPVRLSGQGCSDAGVCTVPSMRHSAEPMDASQYLQIGLSYGRGERGMHAWNSSLQYGTTVGGLVSVDAKAVFSSHSFGAVTASGLADISLSASVQAANELTLLAGIKLPVADGNHSENGEPLPMDLQPGLGTVDIIAGMAYATEHFLLSGALQQPVRQNANTFIAERSSAESGFRDFPTTSAFFRAGDVMLRFSVPVRFDAPWMISPSIIPIYHLANDTYVDSAGITRSIAGSQGLTLNAALFIRYTVSHGNSLEWNIGFPLITRTARPDGLTRSFVITTEYRMEL